MITTNLSKKSPEGPSEIVPHPLGSITFSYPGKKSKKDPNKEVPNL